MREETCKSGFVKFPDFWLHSSSFQTAVEQVVLIQPEVVPQLMQVSRAHFFAEELFVGFGQVPEVFQEEDDLRRQGLRGGLFIGEFRADEETQCVRFDAVLELGGVGVALEGNGQGLRPVAERLRQRGERCFHLGQGQGVKFLPVEAHGHVRIN